MKRNNESTMISLIVCIIFVFVGLIIIVVIAPYAVDAIGYRLERGLDTTTAIMIFIMAILLTLLFSAYALLLFFKRKKRANPNNDIAHDDLKRYGEYDSDRKYLENRIDELAAKLVSTQKRWEEAYHIVLSSNEKSVANSGMPMSDEFLSKYGIDVDSVEVNNKLVFILTPFSEKYMDEYYAIRTACNESGFHAIRGDEELKSGEIFSHIINMISKSRFVVANINGRNPNVFYELGIAHMMNKPTILISRDGQDIPFDLMSRRVILYDSVMVLQEKLRESLRHYSDENSDVVYDELTDNTISTVANKVRRIIAIYNESPAKKQYALDLLHPIFKVDSQARKLVISESRNFKQSFQKILGKAGMRTLKKLLFLIDEQAYIDIDFSYE